LNRKIVETRAPNGMGWDEKNSPWDLQAVPSHPTGFLRKNFPSHPIPWDLQIVPSHSMG